MIVRQGDVLLKQIDKLPEKVKKLEDKVLAYGEITGHSHRLENPENIERYTDGEKLYLQVFQPTPLIHEEHLPQVVLPGVYEQIREREYSYIDQDIRAVVD